MKCLLWHPAGERLSKHDLDRRLSLQANGNGEVVATEEHRDGSVTLMPIDSVRQVVAVVFVPNQAGGKVARNRIRLAPGLHELRHADRLDVHHDTFWISVESSAEETEYDPEQHPSDAFCFLTKARLNRGDLITICPGTPETTCGLLYKQEAWVMAHQSPTPFGCPNCGFTPARAAWAPPARRSRQSLNRLFQLAVQASGEKP